MQHTRWEQARGEAFARIAIREERDRVEIARRERHPLWIFWGCVATLLLGLSLNNPQPSDLSAHLLQQATSILQHGHTEPQIGAIAGAAWAAQVFEKSIVRHNLGIASLFELPADGRRGWVLGIAGQYVGLGMTD